MRFRLMASGPPKDTCNISSANDALSARRGLCSVLGVFVFSTSFSFGSGFNLTCGFLLEVD